MAKRRTSIRVRLPPYDRPRNAWRVRLHEAILQAVEARGVVYATDDRLEVRLRLYLPASSLASNDVDNRLKDVLDALQGRAGGPKKIRGLRAIIPNDRQIFRVCVEKSLPPRQSHGLGHLYVGRLRAGA